MSEEVQLLIEAIRRQAARRDSGCAIYINCISLTDALLLIAALESALVERAQP